MNDFDKNEWLERMDIRLFAIAEMLKQHEKFVVSTLCPPNKSHNAIKAIDEGYQTFFNDISEYDRKICETYEQAKKESRDEYT